MELELEEWEVWHTYTTYLDSSELNLELGALTLVDSGVADCVMSSDGHTWWRGDNGVAQGTTTFTIDPDTGSGSFTLSKEEHSAGLPKGFAQEAWGQAAYFIIGEHRVLGDEPSLSDAYIRAYLGKCVVTRSSEDGTTSQSYLYPTLVIYASGVLVLEFRMIGPPSPVQLETFITSAVNLPRQRLVQVLVNPGLARNATTAYYRSSPVSFFKRFGYSYRQELHNLAIRQRTETHQDEDFSFELSPWSGESESLRSVALSIFHTCSYLVTGPRTGISFLLLGPRLPPHLGDFWSGRPHIHLIRFGGQMDTASENELAHGNAFAAILARTPATGLDLSEDLRLFEDYSVYIGATASLWVWAKKGLKQQQKWSDPNRGAFIYERQAVMELLEFGYMLHRGFYHQVEQLQSTDQVMATKRQILHLRLRMREASHSGEIRRLLEAGWKELGLPTLAQEIEEALSLRESEMRSLDAFRATRVGWIIATIFGLVAVPGLADQVVIPIWHISKIHPVTDIDHVKVVAAMLAFCGIAFVLLLSVMLFSIVRPKR